MVCMSIESTPLSGGLEEKKENIDEKISELIDSANLINFRNTHLPKEIYKIANENKKEVLDFFEDNIKVGIDSDFRNNKKLIETLGHLSCHGLYNGDIFTGGEQKDFLEKLQTISDKKDVTYFTSLFSKAIIDKSKSVVGQYYKPELRFDYIEIQPDIFARVHNGKIFLSEKKDKDSIKKIKEESSILSQKMTSDIGSKKRKFLKLIYGKDAFIGSSHIQNFTQNEAMLHEKLVNKELKIDNINEEIREEYISMIDPKFAEKIQEELNFEIKELSITEQIYFLNYVSSIKNSEAYKIKDFSKIFGVTGFKTFLSLEHGGQEMGDKILELAEILPEKDAQFIFEDYSEMLKTANHLKDRIKENKNSELEAEFRNKLADEVSEAVVLRAKDILLSAHHVATNKSEKFSVSDVRNSLDGITKMLSIIGDLGEGQDYDFSAIQENEFGKKFSVIEKETKQMYELKTFVRSKAEKNAQARINFELNFDTKYPNKILKDAFHNMIISHKQDKVMEGSVLRVGIDREDFEGKPKLSLDFGRSEREDEELTRTGDVLGNLLSEIDKEGHHTTGTFSPEFAEEENFSKIAELFLKYIKDQKN